MKSIKRLKHCSFMWIKETEMDYDGLEIQADNGGVIFLTKQETKILYRFLQELDLIKNPKSPFDKIPDETITKG